MQWVRSFLDAFVAYYAPQHQLASGAMAQPKPRTLHTPPVTNVSQLGIDLIKKWEGFRNHVYMDAAGLPTIGYGHLIRTGEEFTAITEAEAEALLHKDVRKAVSAVQRLIVTPLTQNQFDALVSFTFNLGGGALQRSTLRRKVNRGDVQGAAREFPRWVYAGGRKLRGLQRRRAEEASLFLG